MGIFDIFKGQDINRGIEEYRATEGAHLIDVRTPEEYKDGHIPGAKNLPLQSVGTIGSIVPNKDTTIFVYCLSGGRSSSAVKAITKMGYSDVRNIGGISAYKGNIEK